MVATGLQPGTGDTTAAMQRVLTGFDEAVQARAATTVAQLDGLLGRVDTTEQAEPARARFDDVSKNVSAGEKALAKIRATADGLRATLAAQVQDAHHALTTGTQSQ
jgi:hypothetical protein